MLSGTITAPRRASASQVSGNAAMLGSMTATWVDLPMPARAMPFASLVHPPAEGAIGDGLAALEEVPGNPLGRLGCSLVKDRGNVRGQRLGLDPSPARVERRHLQAEHVASRHSLRPPSRALRNAKHAADVSEADPLLMVLLRQADGSRVFVRTASGRICRRPNSSDIGRVAAKADAADAIGEPVRQSSRRRPPRIPWQRSRAAGSAGRPAAVASRSPATAAA